MAFINDKVTIEISSFLKQYENIDDVVLFGSRARGDCSSLSDYDIAIYGNLTESEMAEIFCFMEYDINTLKKVDVIYMQKAGISNALIENINRDGVSLW